MANLDWRQGDNCEATPSRSLFPTGDEGDMSPNENPNGMSTSVHVRGGQERPAQGKEIGESIKPATTKSTTSQTTSRGGSKIPNASQPGMRPQTNAGEPVDHSQPESARRSIRNVPIMAARHAVTKQSVSYAQVLQTPPRTSSITQNTRASNPARQAQNPPRKIEQRSTQATDGMELEPFEKRLQETRQRVANSKAAASERERAERAAAAEAQRRYMERLSTPRTRRQSASGSVTGSEPDSPKGIRMTRRIVPRESGMKRTVNSHNDHVTRGQKDTRVEKPIRTQQGPREQRQSGPSIMVPSVASSEMWQKDHAMDVSRPSQEDLTTSSCVDGTTLHLAYDHLRQQHQQPRGDQPGPRSRGFLGQITSFLTPDDELEKQARKIAAMGNHIHVLSQQLDYERRKNEKLQHDLLDLKQTNDQFAADLREVQVKSFKEMAKSSWTPMEDHIISDILGDVHKEIEDWCDENCADNFDQMRGRLSKKDETTLLDFLKLVTVVVSDDFGEQLGWWTEKGYDPVLLSTAVITHLMYDSVCVNEFSVVDALLGGAGASIPLSQTFQALLAGKLDC